MNISLPTTIDRATAAESVRDRLQAMIEAGDFAPKERLPSEAELAELFGVSRPVIREALGSLRALGLIVSHSGRGSFVARRTPFPVLLEGRYSFDDVFEVRIALESENAALAAQHRTKSDLKKLAGTLEELSSCPGPDEWSTLDATFHRFIGDATRNLLRAHLVDHLRDLFIEQSRVVLAVAGRLKQANEEHRSIYAGIEAGDARAARRAMSAHLRAAWTETLAAQAGRARAGRRRAAD